MTYKSLWAYLKNLNQLPYTVVQSLSSVHLFATPWTAAHQAFLSFTIPGVCSNSCPLSWWCHPTISSSSVSSCSQSFPATGSFPMSRFFASGNQSIGASASVLPMNIRSWFPWGLTGLVSLLSKGLSTVFSNLKASILWRSAFFMVQLSHWYMISKKTRALTIWRFASKVISRLFNTLSRFVISYITLFKRC